MHCIGMYVYVGTITNIVLRFGVLHRNIPYPIDSGHDGRWNLRHNLKHNVRYNLRNYIGKCTWPDVLTGAHKSSVTNNSARNKAMTVL